MPILGVIASSMKGAPGIPTIGTATNVGTGRAYNNGAATVTFTPAAGATATSFTATSSPGGFTGSAASSPITVAGLQSGVSYTFTVTATNASGTSAASNASNSITATTIPQTPTITSATRSSNTVVSIAFTGATGGSALTAVTATSSPSVSISSSGTSSPMTATATYVQGTSYTFTITASNANGTSSASAASSAVTPYPVPSISSWASATQFPIARNEVAAQGTDGIASAGGRFNTTVATNDGYNWDGSSWTATPLNAVRAAAAVAKAATTFQVTGGYNASGNYENSTFWKDSFNGNWAFGNNLPATPTYLSANSGAGTNGVVVVFGQATPLVYYRTNQSGNFTAGTNAPFTDVYWGCANNDYTRAYFVRQNDTIFYYTNSTASSWTADTALPFNFNSGAHLAQTQNCFWASGGNFNTQTARYNNGTWTLQTSTPVYWAVGHAGGIQGSYWSLFANRQNNVEQQQAHYRALIS